MAGRRRMVGAVASASAAGRPGLCAVRFPSRIANGSWRRGVALGIAAAVVASFFIAAAMWAVDPSVNRSYGREMSPSPSPTRRPEAGFAATRPHLMSNVRQPWS